MIFYCEKCDDVHRLSQAALASMGEKAIKGEAHYVTREKLPGGIRTTVVRMHCPFDLGIAQTKGSVVYHHEKAVDQMRTNVRPR